MNPKAEDRERRRRHSEVYRKWRRSELTYQKEKEKKGNKKCDASKGDARC